jgi:hemerythrin-like domain-containing protein
MERSEALTPLSRDHHHGLFVAMKLKRAERETAGAAKEEFLEFWHREGWRHFRIEEELLLPAYARHGSSTDEAVVRVLTDHVDLRRAGRELEADAEVSLEFLRELGGRLEAHIRHEERVLFPQIEAALPDEELARLGAEVERAEHAER